MVNVNGCHLTKNIEHKYLVQVTLLSLAKISCIHEHAEPAIREINIENIMLHVGNNSFNQRKLQVK